MSEPIVFPTEAALDAFVGRFLDRVLPKGEWTHEAHLVVGLWHLERLSFDEALVALREGIRAHNVATGTPNTDTRGYHETLTVFYLRAIEAWADGQPGGGGRLERFRALTASRLCDRGLPLAFYGRERLGSVEARRHWFEPDLQPLERLPEIIAPGAESRGAAFWIRPPARGDEADCRMTRDAMSRFLDRDP